MPKTILFAGSASQGIKTATDAFPFVPLSLGMHTSSSQFYDSSPRKGAMGGDVVIGGDCQNYYVDCLVALSQEGLEATKDRVKEDTIVLYDNSEVSLEGLGISSKKQIGIDFKAVSNSKFGNLASMGATLKIMGVKPEQKQALEQLLKEKADVDTAAVMAGFDSVAESLDDILDFNNKKSVSFNDSYYLMGNEAAVFGAMAAGANFYAGYPITPSSEAMHKWSEVSQLSDIAGYLQGSSEEHAVGVMLGANAAGAKGWTATSGPGLDRMIEQINWAVTSRTPFVIYNVQRGGPSTGMPTLTQTSDLFTAVYGGHGDHPIFVLTPSTPQEIYEIMKLAFKIAWSYKVGVIINSSKEVSQRKNIVRLCLNDFDDKNLRMLPLKKGHRTGNTANDSGTPANRAAVQWLNDRFNKFEEAYDAFSIADFVNIEAENSQNPYAWRSLPYNIFKNMKFEPAKLKSAPEEVYICYGETVPVVKEALGKNGLVALKSVYPYPISIIQQLNSLGTKKILVAECNRGVRLHSERGQLANKVRQYFKGEVVSLSKWDGFPMYPDRLEEYKE
ncbi:hypothetical protein FJZ53_01195 [Candidatus Woesearchaeota archaeon]|nr:hypothetical protein [Candidatus Woesearchaeota archaeon]